MPEAAELKSINVYKSGNVIKGGNLRIKAILEGFIPIFFLSLFSSIFFFLKKVFFLFPHQDFCFAFVSSFLLSKKKFKGSKGKE